MPFTSPLVARRAVLAALPALLTAAAAPQAMPPVDTLTPVGAERQGSADGSIPPWTAAPRPVDPAEPPATVITAQTVAGNAARLPEGALALFARFPDYTIRVFPTHRTATLPASVMQAIARNTVTARAAPEGIVYGVTGAAGGIPFPRPRNGGEIVWNHLLAFWGAAREARVSTWIAGSDGTIEQTAAYRETTDFPYYAPGATLGTVGPYYFKTRRIQEAPAARAGEAYIAWQPLDTAADRFIAWRYLPGEHRVRKAPSLSYDTPDPDSSGYEALDDYYLFFGGLDRYDWRSLGKRELYIPYNNDAANAADPRMLMGPRHANQDRLRYELHRVWVVEGTLAPGKHHVAPRRRLYMDEDSWLAIYSEAWDEDGHLWKFGQGTMTFRPEIPAVIIGAQFIYDLQQGGYCLDFDFGGPLGYYRVTAPHDASRYSADALAAVSLR